MLIAQSKRGGARKGAGRKTNPTDPTVIVSYSMPASVRDKIKLLGGSKFIRAAAQKEST